MGTLLGLDLGTNSIGWAVVEKNKDKFNLIDYNGKPSAGVMIFSEGVKIEKGTEKSRASERTAYRSARRLKFRRKLRKYETLKVLIEYGLCPLPIEELEEWKESVNPKTGKKERFKRYPRNDAFIKWQRTSENDLENPYRYRDLFSRTKQNWENDKGTALKLGRAFYHLAQRRGFKSNRLEQDDDKTIDNVKNGLIERINETNSIITLNESLSDCFEEFDFENRNKTDLDETEQKLKSIYDYCSNVINNKLKKAQYNTFSEKKEEIARYLNRKENLGPVKLGIRNLTEKIEESGHSTLGQYFWHLYKKDRTNSENKIRTNYTGREEHYEFEFLKICEVQNIGNELREKLFKAIFFQRPLRSQKGSVGKCTLEKDKPRCPVSRPEFEEYRMWAYINSIKVQSPEDETLRPLNKEERNRVKGRFYRQKKTFKFEDITKAIRPDAKFNYFKERDIPISNWKVNYPLTATVTGNPVSASFKNVFGEDFETMEISYSIKNQKGELRDRNADYRDIWHALFSFEDEKLLYAYCTEKLKLSDLKARKLCRTPILQGYASLSLNAINKILPWLRDGLIYSHAVFMANIRKVIKKESWDDPENRRLIESEFKNIIDSQQTIAKKITVINNVLSNLDDLVYTDINNPEYIKGELNNQFEKLFGVKTWNEHSEKENLLVESIELVINQLKKRGKKEYFLKLETIENRIKAFLEDHDLLRDENSFEKLYHPSDLDDFQPIIRENEHGEQIKLLPLPRTESIKNPVLLRSMHKLRQLINELLESGVIDSNTRIHLEMAREVNDANRRAAWKSWQDSLHEKREAARKKIAEHYFETKGKAAEPSEDEITRYLLWDEQNHKEIYETESRTISLSDIMGPDPRYDIEHTIPRSLSWDNSMMNKTLCSKKFNREIKKNKIPYELRNHDEILERIDHWRKDYLKLEKEIERINTSGISDKQLKDRLIQKRHKLRFEYDYLKGKYERFKMREVPDGFKNSQMVDTGLITRFARKYLKSVFQTASGNSNVFVVNGQAVAEFRKAWGIQQEYEKKSRASHLHHCMDAVTIACMTKTYYDRFAEHWRKAEEQYEKYNVLAKLNIPKPWESFTEDVLGLDKSILVSHDNRDNVKKHTKKKERKRGKIQFKKGTKKPIYLQGDTARGALHQDTYYGSIMVQGEEKPVYVIRKFIEELSDSDLKKIVDIRIREIAIDARKEEKRLKKRIKELKNDLSKSEDPEVEARIREQIQETEKTITDGLYVIPPKAGKTVTTPIRKVRIRAHVTEPLPNFKKHRDVAFHGDGKEKHPHKTWYYVANDENYGLALYESEDRKTRKAQIVNLLDASEHFKRSNRDANDKLPVVEETIEGIPFRGLLRKNMLVLFYKNEPDEIWELPFKDLCNRLYYIKKTNKDGRVTFQHHSEARNNKELINDYIQQHGVNPPKSLFNGESNIDFLRLPIPKLLLSPSNFNMLIEGIDFRITYTGKLKNLTNGR